ncbi:hypothetical protein BP5796_00643 [Coleophoma crateriformis]|uniref:DNA-directed RNA polymerase III RPC4 n=1 Tax=Coleophoma crateriformis TaxID=565419 RepID=A0A3D8T8J9_9HELO|nr:hypothetical protein BP5796_00643 [Coleophoma crateriformis]
MPPKGAPRGRGAGRGRGRGGKAAASTAPEGDQPSTDTGIDGAASSADPVTNATSTQPSPNSSPADVPTETPASTPNQPPIQRAPSSRGRGDSARGASSSRGRGDSTAGAAKSKFKPKIIRRDQSERDLLQQQAEKRAEQLRKDAEFKASRAAKAMMRGRGRGRGDAMGRGTLLGRGGGGTASGPFAMAPDEIKSSGGDFTGFSVSSGGGGGGGGGGGSGGRSGGFSTSKGIKTEGGGTWGSGGGSGGRGRNPGDADFYEPNYPDEDDGPRIDIERINLVSDDDEPVVTSVTKVNKGKAAPGRGGLRPVRLDRVEHKERVAIVNTDSAVKLPDDDDDTDVVTADGNAASRIAPPAEPQREWKGVYLDDEDVKVKPEPDASLVLASIPSPELKKAELVPGAKNEIVSPVAKKTRSHSHSKKKKEKKPVLQTEEDKAEYERHLEDVAILANELGGLQARADSDGDINMEGGTEAQVDQKEGRLYLFQFPPILPPLCHPDEAGGDVEIVGTTTHDNEFTKLEGQEEEVMIKTENKDDFFQGREQLVSEEGFIGKLIVRESGKVELSWGGTSLVVGRGVESGFLSTVVVTDDRPGMEEGVAMGMGKVMGKFVVTPDFEKMI